MGINTSQSPIDSEHGIELYVSDPKQQFKVEFNFDENPILLGPGHNRVELKPTTTELLPKPYNNCGEKYFDSSTLGPADSSAQANDLYHETISLIGAYSQEYCFEVLY